MNEKNKISDAENSKGSAKNEAYRGLDSWDSNEQLNPYLPWGSISFTTELYFEYSINVWKWVDVKNSKKTKDEEVIINKKNILIILLKNLFSNVTFLPIQ